MSESAYPGNELDLFCHADNWKAYFSKHICPYLHGHVLEVGAGIGATTRVLSSNEHHSWTCLEPDPKLVEKHSLYIDLNNPHSNYKHVIGNISDIDDQKHYDTILYIDVLEHIENDDNEIKQAANLLSNNGVIIILSPAYQWLFNEFDQAIGHFRRYNKQTLTASVPVELEQVCIMYLDSVGAIASIANSVLLHQTIPTIKQVLFWDRAIIPFSKVIDPVILYSFGKSILGVWKKSS